MLCPICNKRKAERFCPAKGEKICAVCCGTEREVTIDCPVDCAYLIAAHRYERRVDKPVPESEVPYPDVQISPALIHEQRAVVSGLAFAILRSVAETPSAVDTDALAALQAIAEAYRTLGSGIYYEKPPAGGPPLAIYEGLKKFIEEFSAQLERQGHGARLKPQDLFHFLLFLLRVGRQQTSVRPRSRTYLEFLRAQFPRATAASQTEPSRIIVP
jgi:hypothetical protein